MPEMDGLEASRLIHQQWSPELCPHIIAISANVMSEEQDKCWEVGINDLITKPINVSELAQALRQVSRIDIDITTWQNVFDTKKNQQFSNNIKNDSTIKAELIIDLTVLESIISMGDEQLLGEIIENYLDFAPSKLAAIKEAIVSDDGNELQLAAHVIRSSSLSLGGLSLGKISSQLEDLGRANNTMEAAKIFPILEIEYQQFKRELINFMSSQ
mgnify:FL=1